MKSRWILSTIAVCCLLLYWGMAWANTQKDSTALASTFLNAANLLAADRDHEGAEAAYTECLIHAGGLENAVIREKSLHQSSLCILAWRPYG